MGPGVGQMLNTRDSFVLIVQCLHPPAGAQRRCATAAAAGRHPRQAVRGGALCGDGRHGVAAALRRRLHAGQAQHAWAGLGSVRMLMSIISMHAVGSTSGRLLSLSITHCLFTHRSPDPLGNRRVCVPPRCTRRPNSYACLLTNRSPRTLTDLREWPPQRYPSATRRKRCSG